MNNAMREGVSPGGLYSKENIRIMICYLLASLRTEISKTAFAEILSTTELVNYFELSDALMYLENSDIVSVREQDGDYYYSINESGKNVAEHLCYELPRSSRDKALLMANKVVNRERMRRCTDVGVSGISDGGFNVTMTVYDDDKNIMMQTTLYAADNEQAQILSERFLDDPSKLYSAIIDTLTE